jgi:hypothetical protein
LNTIPLEKLLRSQLVSSAGISFMQPGFSLLKPKWRYIGINHDYFEFSVHGHITLVCNHYVPMFASTYKIYFISSRSLYIPQLVCKTAALIGAVAELRKATVSYVMSVFLFVCLSALNSSAPSG